MGRLASMVVRRPRIVVGVWVVLVLVGGALASRLDERLQNGGYDVPGSESARVSELVEQQSGSNTAARSYVSVVSSEPQGPSAQSVQGVRRGLQSADAVVAVGAPLVSPDRRSVLLPVTLRGSIGEQQRRVAPLQDRLDELAGGPVTATLIGQAAVFHRYGTTSKEGLERASFIVAPVTLVILLVAFTSLVAATLPLVLGIATIGVTFGALYVLALLTQLSFFVQDVSLILGLGLSIDFSLFMVSRVREEIASGSSDVEGAVTSALTTTGRAIAISTVTVASSVVALVLVGVGIFTSMAAGAVLAVLIAGSGALTLTPAILVLLRGRSDRVSLPFAKAAAERARIWRWVSELVVRRRIAVVATVIPLLILLSLPARAVDVSMPTFSVLPSDDPVRQASERATAAFGPGAQGPIVVQARGADPRRLVSTVRAVPGIAQVGRPQAGRDGWVRLDALLTTVPDSQAATDTVERLRTSLDRRFGPEVLVGGPSAEALDLIERVRDRTPLVVAALLCSAMILLTVLFRAPLIAFKAALTTLLTVTATVGITMLLFGNDPIAFYVPLILLTTVFGLSTDYEVFLLSRIREEYRKGVTNSEAIKRGLVRSARSITFAGLAMASVFFAFGTASLLPLRQLGVGMGIAVILEVTVVRTLLVPATLALLGKANWWFPKLGAAAPGSRTAESRN